jgi:3-hydroxyisobutyrate dehydrogenase-like beta-hydroxyacid dehydrogenase
VIGYIHGLDRAAEIRARGLDPKFSIADLFDCHFVVNMLPDDRAVREVVFGKIGEAGWPRPDALHRLTPPTVTLARDRRLGPHETW